MRFFISFLISSCVLAAAKDFGMPETYHGPLSMLVFFVWCFFGWPKGKKRPVKVDVQENPNNALMILNGVSDILEVFENKVTITPKKTASAIIVRGFKGTKSIPFASITAIQLREANPINGYIQFSILGGNESTRGVVAAISDENTCFFTVGENETAKKIAAFIEERLGRAPQMPQQNDVTGALEKLAELKKIGVLSDDEFAAAKVKLLK